MIKLDSITKIFNVEKVAANVFIIKNLIINLIINHHITIAVLDCNLET